MSDDLLPSWRDGATRSKIVEFLDHADEIPTMERVAVFDNDGTLMCEKPGYTQLEFMQAELRRSLLADPSLGERPEFRALIDRDRDALVALGLPRVAIALVELLTGIEPEEFDERVRSFVAGSRHPDRGVPYRRMRYQPMLELIDALRARAFDVYIVTGGGTEFVRVFSHDFYGVAAEGVVGSQIDYDVVRNDATLKLLRTNRLVGDPNEGPAKPKNIQQALGRRPAFAAGNSAGDADMLDYARSATRPSMCLLVDHDDADREYAYVSEAGTFASEESILETAARSGWTVASIRNDWSTVFSPS